MKKICFSVSGLEWPGGEVDHSPHSRADVKNVWINNYIPPIRFHEVERDLTLHAS
jgi:hypothetical protein